MRPGAASAEGFDPFGEQQKKKAAHPSSCRAVRFSNGQIFAEEAPKDLKNPPPDVQASAVKDAKCLLITRVLPSSVTEPIFFMEVTKSGLKYKILKPVDCESVKCSKPNIFDKVSVDFTGRECKLS